MATPLPEIPESETTPLVRQLLDVIGHLQNRIQELQDEILRLKGLGSGAIIAAVHSRLLPSACATLIGSGFGSAKRQTHTITDQVVSSTADPPPGSIWLRRLRGSRGSDHSPAGHPLPARERWQTPNGQSLVAEFPAEVRPDSHFGPTLICFIIHQYHHQALSAQPLLWNSWTNWASTSPPANSAAS